MIQRCVDLLRFRGISVLKLEGRELRLGEASKLFSNDRWVVRSIFYLPYESRIEGPKKNEALAIENRAEIFIAAVKRDRLFIFITSLLHRLMKPFLPLLIIIGCVLIYPSSLFSQSSCFAFAKDRKIK